MSAEHIGGEAVEHTKSALSHKIGPLPAGVWALAILGGVGVAVMVRRNANDQATQDAADTIDSAGPSGYDQPDPGGTTPGVGGSTSAGSDGSYPQDGGTGTDTTPNGPDPMNAAHKARAATSNSGWQHWTVEAMSQLGFAPGRVNAVLSAYLAGDRLDGTGTAILGAAMARCGPPPHPPKHKADPGTGHPAPAHGGNHEPAHHHHHGTKDHGTGVGPNQLTNAPVHPAVANPPHKGHYPGYFQTSYQTRGPR